MRHEPPTNGSIRRKRRTREHIIAELSANFVERRTLEAGYSVERIQHDYGIDLLLFTYNEKGEIENGSVSLQLKASDTVRVLADQETIAFPIARSDLEYWLDEFYPCVLIVYDALADEAFWLYVQAYFQGLADFNLATMGESVTVHLMRSNRVTRDTMRQFAGLKARVLEQVEKAEIKYGD